MIRAIVAGLVGVLAGMGAEVRWCGGEENANFSTAANWEGGAVPAEGDELVFAGGAAEAVNDLEGAKFSRITFENAGNTGFTISGNKFTVTGGFSLSAGRAGVTNVVDAEVEFTGNLVFGKANTANNALVFKKPVRRTSGYGEISAGAQVQSFFKFEDVLEGVNKFYRPNGNGTWWLTKPIGSGEDAWVMYDLNQGYVVADSIAALTQSGKVKLRLGQGSWTTTAYLRLNSQEPVSALEAEVTVRSPTRDGAGGVIENMVEGTRLELSGWMKGETTASGSGAMMQFGGAGDGVFLGEVQASPLWVEKVGSGTWEMAGRSQSSRGVTVRKGLLRVSGDWSAVQGCEVMAGGRIGGPGAIGDLTFEDGGVLYVRKGADGAPEKLTVSGALTMKGMAKVMVDGDLELGTYTVMEFGSIAGMGAFGAVDRGGMTVRVAGNRVELVVAKTSEELTWTGAVNSKWNFTDANWATRSGEAAVYEDGKPVKFPAGIAEEDKRRIEVEAEVRPQSVTVEGDGDWRFAGEHGIAGSGWLLKRGGTGELTLATTNTYTGETRIETGAFTLEGRLTDSPVWIDAGVAFTNAVTGEIKGNARLTVYGSAELNGTNDFGGVLFASTEQGGTGCVVNDAMALGNGDIVLEGKQCAMKVLDKRETEIGRGRTLYLRKKENNEISLMHFESGQKFTWLGEVVLDGTTSGATFHTKRDLQFGEPGCTTEVRSVPGGLGLRCMSGGTYAYHWYSRIDLGSGTFSQTHDNTHHLYAAGNVWSEARFQVGVLSCRADGALPKARIYLGQKWGKTEFKPRLELNGTEQTVSGLVMEELDTNKSRQTVHSEEPATLTVENAADTRSRMWYTDTKTARVEGAVTLRKRGAGKWTFEMQNLATGDFIVDEGTLELPYEWTLPTASRLSRLVVNGDAKVLVPEGVDVKVPRLWIGSRRLPAGRFGGVECAVEGVARAGFILGGGTITLTKGDGGTMILVK